MTGISAFDPERAARQAGLGVQILQNCRNELLSLFPHLDGAFAVSPAVPGTVLLGPTGPQYFSRRPGFCAGMRTIPLPCGGDIFIYCCIACFSTCS